MPVPILAEEFINEYFDKFDVNKAADINQIHEAIYSSILLLNEAMKTSFNNKVDFLRPAIMKKVFSVPSGDIKVIQNYYTTRLIYFIQYRDGKAYVTNQTIGPIDPEVYIPLTASNHGKTCQLLENFHTNESILPYKELHFYHEWDGINVEGELLKGLLEEYYVTQLNINNPLPGYSLIPTFTYRPLVRNELLIEAKKLSTNLDIIGSFGCSSSECRNAVTESYVQIKRLILFTGTAEGQLCDKYLIVIGTIAAQKNLLLLEYFSSSNVETFICIGDTTNSTKSMVQRIEQEIETRGLTLLKSCLSELEDVETFKNCLLENTDRYLGVVRFVIVIYYRNELLTKVFKLLPNILDSQEFQMAFMFYDEYLFPRELTEYYTGSLIVKSYDRKIVSELNQEFLLYLQTSLFRNIVPTEEMEFAYDALQLWRLIYFQAFKDNNNSFPSDEYLRLALLNTGIATPSGKLTVLTNNYASRTMYLLQLDENSILTQIYPTPGEQIQIDPTVFYKSDGECQFGKEKTFFKINSKIVQSVLIIFIIIASLCFIMIITIYLNSETKVIKFSSPLFNYFSLISLIVLSANGYLFTLEPSSNNVMCALRVWPLVVFLDCLFGLMITKSWRIHKLFNNKQLKKVNITNIELLKILGVMILVQLVYLMLWWLVDPSTYVEVYSNLYSDYYFYVYTRECTVSYPFVILQILFIFFFLLSGLYLAWGIRKASSEFNESFAVSASILSLMMIGFVLIPLDFILYDQPQTLVVIRAAFAELIVVIILFIQFTPKFYSIYIQRTTSSFSLSSNSRRSSEQSLGGEQIKKRNQMKQLTKFYMDVKRKISPIILAEAYNFPYETIGRASQTKYSIISNFS